MRVFREKAVTGMKCVAVGCHRQVHNSMCAEVSGNRIRTQAEGLISFFDVKSISVSVCIDSNRFNLQFSTSSHNANSDFTAIGDQNLFDQGLTHSK